MDALLEAHDKVEKQGGLAQAIDDVQAIIDILSNARDSVAGQDGNLPMTMAKLKNPVNQSFTKLNADVKALHSVINNYSKAVDRKFKNLVLPTASNDPFSSHPHLTNRAIGMHLLREGQFGVASTFIAEAMSRPPRPQSVIDPKASGRDQEMTDTSDDDKDWVQDFASTASDRDDIQDDGGEPDLNKRPTDLQRKFKEMYRILVALQSERNISPALDWALTHSDALEARGSNLRFELCRMHFVILYTSGNYPGDNQLNVGRLNALEYARVVFPSFPSQYHKEINSLLGSLAYAPAIGQSPYKNVLYDEHAWSELANSFVREFCGLLGMSEKSPLYTAVTAGGIALPVLEKLERVMTEAGGQWTSANELPVEIPLPPSYLFHSIFVCPVSKEQATDTNPPMMLPCGHVIANESLEKVTRGHKVKCPYCPVEATADWAKRVTF